MVVKSTFVILVSFYETVITCLDYFRIVLSEVSTSPESLT